ncbi:alpha-ketoglutarate-dependent 2,4-dichlorophenoxyacetate dioxygenase [Cladophialophora yegresii CBS 114405]|uniref:Alpha-ketoglutarate-dependent 2,4-dichlorophenoxyacetate dioxygenase n=1 Tax=Cladophialophora yegresii CBS 114405 TaxID=1182544 RepID=W9W461_9EURO|nr:alpha-ketoglutarate-dependent 2,4-dichlorophenoxyacetate dioxygenase [Cladophialophora yegresii CBS 114405]EXJ62758.1 alpha-ketoglutarate-dependent 2,4-dichlorophenoxyacetate dioxygenase [Cladophialophora yegresii CBS 114405]
MGSYSEEPEFKTLSIKKLHPTFAAEVEGVNFQNLSDEQFQEIFAAMAKYGVCMFRSTGLSDEAHIAFSKRIGDLDTMRRYMVDGRKPRYGHYELFDAGNIDDQGGVLDPNSPRAHYGKGNALFHVDSSFNPRRASFSLLRAVHIPPPGNGGNTDFADSRTAWDELDPEFQKELLEKDYTVNHSIAQSRKLGSPEFFKDLDPTNGGVMARHRLIQTHEPSGRRNIYIAAHSHSIEGLPKEESDALIKKLLDHVTQKKYTTSVEWKNPSDMIIWDNRCTLHRANGGTFEGKYKRDLRRTTVHDDSSTAWGLNEKQDTDDWVVNHSATKAAAQTQVK